MKVVLNAVYPQSELYWYFRNFDDRVDAYVRPWPRPRSMSAFLHYSLTDIGEPLQWHLACCYHFLGVAIWPDSAAPPPLSPPVERSRL